MPEIHGIVNSPLLNRIGLFLCPNTGELPMNGELIDKVTNGHVELIKLEEVMSSTKLSKASIYEQIQRNTFPRQVSLGSRSVAWVKSEVEQWKLERIALRDKESA
ncbi:helix-turn-helix transcriptional regulator [Vibrio sp. RC27]